MTTKGVLIHRLDDLLPPGVEVLTVFRCPVCKGSYGTHMSYGWELCSYCKGEGATSYPPLRVL